MDYSGSDKVKKLEAQLVIVGGGGSGLAAAAAAAEKVKNVIVLEKRRIAGGNSVMAEGLFAAESKYQKRQGIDAGRDEIFKIAMGYAHWMLNPRLIRAIINKSGDTIQWLEGMGASLDYIVPAYPNQVPQVWHCHPQKAGPVVIKALVNKCKALGVKLLYQTAAKRIILNEHGNVAGILVEAEGKEVEIAATSIVVGTGGYGGNRELLEKYCPYYTEDLFCRGLPHMGDGILMASEINADTIGLGTLLISGARFRASFESPTALLCREPNTVWVNKMGERFIDESNPLWPETGTASARQPDSVSYTIFDEKIKQNFIENGPVRGMEYRMRPKTNFAELDKQLKSAENKGTVKISDCWDDISHWIGANPEDLRNTIDEYNSFCDEAHDEIFVKDREYLQPLRTPPYYSIKSSPTFLVTLGGIKVNHRMEVINQENRPIPGLYAVGNDAGGWEPDTYNLLLTGGAFGFAINSGRIAGENAAEYALRE